MVEEAYTLPASKAKRRFYLSFQVELAIWWIIWLFLLAFLFSGFHFTLGSLNIKTITLDTEFMAEWWRFISKGVIVTFQLSIVSIICATILALCSALARISRIPALSSLAGLYISLMRGTPLFLQVLFVYLALPEVGLIFGSFVSGIIALSLNYGAYMSEIFRAGIQAVGYGQTEAAYALGMTPAQTMRRIILPQAFRIIIPDIGNQFIAMQKDTALVSAIAIPELIGLARQAGTPNQRLFEALVIAAIWYWLLTIVFTFFQSRLEQKMARGDRNHGA